MRKRIPILLALLFAFTFLFACTQDPDPPRPSDIVGIEVVSPPNKTEYWAGESFDTAGTVLARVRRDGDTRPLDDYAYAPVGPLTEDDTRIVFTYANNDKEFTCFVEITVTQRHIRPPDMTRATFYDDFEDGELDTELWEIVHKGDGFGNGEAQFYTPDNIEVSDGTLKLVARKEPYQKPAGVEGSNRDYTSAKITTQNKFSQTYGRFEAKIRMSSAFQGFWPAFWMMPNDNFYGGWPRSGEIDIMEMKGSKNYNASSTVHFGANVPSTYKYGNNNEGANRDPSFLITDWHVYSCDWQEGKLSFYVDSRLLFSHDMFGEVVQGPPPVETGGGAKQWHTQGIPGPSTAPFDKPFYMILNFAIGGSFDGGTPKNPLAFAEKTYMEVDWVRAFDAEYIEEYPMRDGNE